MPLILANRFCLALDVEAYIVIHSEYKEFSDYRRLLNRAGPELAESYERSGIVADGDPVITPAFSLPTKYIIHALQSGKRVAEGVSETQCMKALRIAQEQGCESVAFVTSRWFLDMREVKLACMEFLTQSDMRIYLSGYENEFAGISGGLVSRLNTFLQNDFGQQQDGKLETTMESAIFDGFSESIGAQTPEDFGLEQAIESIFSPHEEKTSGEYTRLQNYLKQTDAGFRDTLLKYIDRTGRRDSEIYKKANIDRRLFSKILNVQGYNPSKPTAIAFAIALELNLEETKDLIGRAGYTLSHASTFDRIIEFFILEGNYDIYEINEALFYFDQSLLGC